MSLFDRVRFTLPLILLLLVSVFVMFYRLGDAPLQDWDEGIYATIAAEMVDRGDYLRMTLMGEPWFEKPILPFWLNALSFRVLGITEFAARFFPALAAIGSILFLYGIGRRLFSWYVGFWAALLFSLSPLFLDYHMARSGDHDVLFLFWLLASIYAMVRSWEKSARADVWLITAGIAAGLAIATRGTLGIFAMLIPLGAHLAFLIKSRIRRQSMPYHYHWWAWVGWVAGWLVIGGAWHVFAYLMYRDQFVALYLREQFLGRIAGVVQGHGGPWWFYAQYLWSTTPFITAAAGLMALFWIWRYSFAFLLPKKLTKLHFTPAVILLGVWVLLFGAALTIMQTKLTWYALGLAPALYLIAVSALNHKGAPRAFATIGIVALLVFYVVRLPHWHPGASAPARDVAAVLNGTVEKDAPLLVYRTAQWNFGRILPASYWYLRYRAQVAPESIDRDNLEHYLTRAEEYRYWLMQKDTVADIEQYPEFAAFTRRDVGDWVLLAR